jgi:hypothetical protein
MMLMLGFSISLLHDRFVESGFWVLLWAPKDPPALAGLDSHPGLPGSSPVDTSSEVFITHDVDDVDRATSLRYASCSTH